MGPSRDTPRIRLAELVATLSLASDVALGKPYEHAQRGAIGAVRLGEALGLGEADLQDTYYLTLLKSIGCVGDDDFGYRILGEDVGQWASHLGMGSPLEFVSAILQNAGKGAGLPKRVARLAKAFTGLPKMMEGLRGHCEVAHSLAPRLGLGERVARGLGQVYERWDGTGQPRRLKGDAIEIGVRLAQVALDADAAQRVLGDEGTIEMIRSRRGKGYDPNMADAFVREAPHFFAATAATSIWDAVLAAEPRGPVWLEGDAAELAIRSMGEYADLKSRYTRGHSIGVANLAAPAARRLRLLDSDVQAVTWAGHLHDIGRMGTTQIVWDKEGPLSDGEWERVRMHAYHTDRILARATSLGPAAVLAAGDHERLDGSGYHRRIPPAAIPPGARVLAAADAYHAMTERRAHRSAMSDDRAAEELRKEARSGRLDGEAVEAVLSAAGHKTRAQPERPGGLSDREIEVLRLVARGLTNKEVASTLEISVKTAGHHLEHIYGKLGVTTRAAAALFAMQHDLLAD